MKTVSAGNFIGNGFSFTDHKRFTELVNYFHESAVCECSSSSRSVGGSAGIPYA
jgi:hypothetical protein